MSETLELIPAEPTAPEEVQIKLDANALVKYRRDERLAEAQAMEEIGSRVLKIKTRVLAKIGADIERLGVKSRGYGGLASGDDNAGTALVGCDELIAEYRAKKPTPDFEVILELMRLKLQFNAQIIAVAESYLKASREAAGGTQTNNLTLPFPPGQAMTVHVAPK